MLAGAKVDPTEKFPECQAGEVPDQGVIFMPQTIDSLWDGPVTSEAPQTAPRRRTPEEMKAFVQSLLDDGWVQVQDLSYLLVPGQHPQAPTRGE